MLELLFTVFCLFVDAPSGLPDDAPTDDDAQEAYADSWRRY